MGKTEHGEAARTLGSPEEKAFIELLHTADRLARGVATALKSESLSLTQYNVLRILRGSPGGLACGDVARRLITREPDITRLLDRMEKRQLISRMRAADDRRTVVTRITRKGLETVNRLDAPIQAVHRKQLGYIPRARLLSLIEALREMRGSG